MIIDFEDIRSVRPIAENLLDEKRLKPYIVEAESLYLKPVFGIALFKNIEDNKDEYMLLLNGGAYNEDKSYLEGLRIAVGYLAYSRFLINNPVNVTAFGVVQKTTQYSEPVDEKTLVRASNDAKKIGEEYLRQCVEYLKFKGLLDSCKPIKVRNKFKSIGL